MYLSTFFSKDVPADQRYMFFSKFLHQLVVERAGNFVWTQKTFDYTWLWFQQRNPCWHLLVPKKQHLLEPTFFWPRWTWRFYSFSDSLFLAPDAGLGVSGNWNIQSGCTEHKSDIGRGLRNSILTNNMQIEWGSSYIYIYIYKYIIYIIYHKYIYIYYIVSKSTNIHNFHLKYAKLPVGKRPHQGLTSGGSRSSLTRSLLVWYGWLIDVEFMVWLGRLCIFGLEMLQYYVFNMITDILVWLWSIIVFVSWHA